MSDDLELFDSSEDEVIEEAPVEEESTGEEEVEEAPVEEEEEKPTEVKTEEEPEPQSRYPRPPMKVIKAKYPELFKDFPALKDAMFREAAYTEVFPTVEDAREAASKSMVFDKFEEDLMSGDAGRLVVALDKTDPEVAQKFINGFLPSLQKLSKEAYVGVLSPVIQGLVRSVYNEGKRVNDSNLQNAAYHLLNYLGFGEEVLTTEQRPTMPQPNPEQEKFNRERQEFYQGRFIQARNVVADETMVDTMSAINESLKVVRGSDYMKQSLARDIFAAVDKAMGSDEKHLGLMESLWKQAERTGFNRASVEKIKTAYISRANALIPGISRKVREQAFGKSLASKAQKVATPKAPVKSGGSGRQIDYRKTSDEDIFDDKITYRE